MFIQLATTPIKTTWQQPNVR